MQGRTLELSKGQRQKAVVGGNFFRIEAIDDWIGICWY